MNEITPNLTNDEKLASLKKTTAIVYLCQVLTLLFAGVPLLVGVVINFYFKDSVKGTWLEAHFNWQIMTACFALTGLAISALTFGILIGWLILVITLILLVYRIVIGWTALNANKAVRDSFFKSS